MLGGCSDNQQGDHSKNLPTSLQPTLENNSKQLNRYVQQQSPVVKQQTSKMIVQIDVFLNAPSKDNLLLAQVAWQSAHEEFLKLRPALLVDTNRLINRIDIWPIQPGFLDSLPNYPTTGIVNDVSIEISTAELIHQHGITSDDEVSLGYHSLEYMLFERKLSDYIERAVENGLQSKVESHIENNIEDSVENATEAKIERNAEQNIEINDAKILADAPSALNIDQDSSIEESEESEQTNTDIAKNINRRALLLSTVAEQLAKDIDLFINQVQTEIEDQQSAQSTLMALVRSLLNNMRQAFREGLLLNEPNLSHGGYSETSRLVLVQELNTLKNYTLGQINLKGLLETLNQANAENFTLTIDQAIALANKLDSTETEQIKLDLMLSSLLHQLEDFETALQLKTGD